MKGKGMTEFTIEVIKKGTSKKPYFEMNFHSSESKYPMFVWLMDKKDLEDMIGKCQEALIFR
jgi:hypothetical protein